MDGAFTYILYRGLDGSSDPGIPGGMHLDMLDARLSLALSLFHSHGVWRHSLLPKNEMIWERGRQDQASPLVRSFPILQEEPNHMLPDVA